RLAAVLAILWGETRVVSPTTLRRAIALVRWLEPHARRVWQRALTGNDEPVLKLARRLVAGTLEIRGKRLAAFTERDITRSQVAGLGLVGEARRVLGVLVAHGWLVREGEKYRVNPRVKEVAGDF
ncbi:MAG: YfjI family protein, partial [Meiothermus sp.]